MSKKSNPDHAALSDRWDGDVYQFGKQVMPMPGPEIAVSLETYVRGLRTGEWPDQELDQPHQSPPENPASSALSREDDPAAPF